MTDEEYRLMSPEERRHYDEDLNWIEQKLYSTKHEDEEFRKYREENPNECDAKIFGWFLVILAGIFAVVLLGPFLIPLAILIFIAEVFFV